MSEPPDSITCVECGGTAHLLSFLPTEESLEEGYPVAYACSDCNERFDLIWTDDEDD